MQPPILRYHSRVPGASFPPHLPLTCSCLLSDFPFSLQHTSSTSTHSISSSFFVLRLFTKTSLIVHAAPSLFSTLLASIPFASLPREQRRGPPPGKSAFRPVPIQSCIYKHQRCKCTFSPLPATALFPLPSTAPAEQLRQTPRSQGCIVVWDPCPPLPSPKAAAASRHVWSLVDHA